MFTIPAMQEVLNRKYRALELKYSSEKFDNVGRSNSF